MTNKKETKKEAFKRIADNRTDKILKQIGLMGNFSNTSFYEYTDKDINDMCDCIIANVNVLRHKLLK